MDLISKVKETIDKYALFSKSDKVFVAYSGGKDSTTVLYLLKKLGYNVSAITIDARIGNYSKENLENIKKFCSEYNIPLHIVSFIDEFGHSLCYLKSILNSKGFKIKSCALCGVLKRYLINKHARLLNADVLVTGHNLDDEAQSIFMNLFKNNLELLARIGPVTGITSSKRFIKRVKPLYFVKEEEIKKFSKKMNFPVVYTPCPCRTDAYRNEMRILLDDYEKTNKKIKENIIYNFIKFKPLLMKKFSGKLEVNSCEYCSEPSKDKICKSCELIEKIK